MYGWPALRRDLIDEGGLTETQLGAVFTCGAWSVQGGRFLVGIARDAHGTRVTVCVCLSFVALGSLLIASCASDDLASMCFGMFFLGLGSGAQLCVQPVAGLFPEATSTAMASLSGAFQLSGLVFLACSIVSAAGAGRFGAYVGHAVFVAALGIASLKVLPRGISFEAETVRDEAMARVVRETPPAEASPRATPEEASGKSRDVDIDLGATDGVVDVVAVVGEHERDARGDATTTEGTSSGADLSIRKPIRRPELPKHFGSSRKDSLSCDEFVCLVVWFSVMVTPSQYYVLSIGYQLEQKGDTDGSFSRAFTLLYGFSAPLAPLAGICADTVGVAFAQFLAVFLSLVGYCALFFESLEAQYFGMASYSAGRMFLFATFFANIGRRFGYEHYGALVGVGMLASAAVSTLQYPMFQWALRGEDQVTAVNVACACCAAACVPYCAWLGARERQERRGGRTG